MKRLVCLLSLLPFVLSAVDWHHPLYLGRGGLWHKRVPITVTNNGAKALNGWPVSLAVGSEPTQADLVGESVAELRIVDQDGTEMLYAVQDADGQPLQGRTLIPMGATLTLPVECASGATVTYYAYVANPEAWPVPDYLAGVSVGELNGGFEKGKAAPMGWPTKDVTPSHRCLWVGDGAQAGKRCVKVEVDADATPNWVAYYHPGMPIVPGAAYVINAWARAENVRGQVGWFIHVGNQDNPMLMNDIQSIGEGTQPWTQVTFRFTAPDDASSLTLGTVLRGTGTAWFDSASISCDAEASAGATVRAEATPAETLSLRETGDTSWHAPGPEWRTRVPLNILNLGRDAQTAVLVHATIADVLRGSVDTRGLALRDGDHDVPFCLLDGALMFPFSLSPGTLHRTYLYIVDQSAPLPPGKGTTRLGSDIPSDQIFVPETPATDPKAYAALLMSPANLVTNPSFEVGSPLPDGWPGAAETTQAQGTTFGTATPGAFGTRCAQYTVPHGSPGDWVGWRQSVDVKPQHSYLFACWVRSVDTQAPVKLHAHQRTRAGALCESRAFLGSMGEATPGDGWTLLSGLTQAPPDCDVLQLHLTMNTTGTIQHDGALIAEVTSCSPGVLETSSQVDAVPLAVWSVDPIRKVFKEDLPPAAAPALELSLARNESEILQLAVRSTTDCETLTLEVTAPTGPGGTLDAIEVHVVGYVPIDHTTSYYSSVTPTWHRKFPLQNGSCDGWPGWWPDPLLPVAGVELSAGKTQPFWVTVTAPTEAAPGTYNGALALRAGGRVRWSAPFSVRVWDFALPPSASLAAIYDLRLGEQWLQTGETAEQARETFMRFMARKRLCADRIQADPVFKRDATGAITADFRAYDREATLFFDELHFPRAYTPGFFYLFGWAHPPRDILGEAPYEGTHPYADVDRSALRSEYKRVYQECLRLYWNHMKEKGWADRLVLYISDEPHFRQAPIRTQMEALCTMIHEVDSAIPIYSSTWEHCPEWNGSIDVWGVGQYGCFPVPEMQARKAAGDRLWFTTDGQMCTDTPYCAIERLLPHYCFKYGVEAYEFWGVNWLTYDPYDWGWHRYIHQSDTPGEYYDVRYPNGDGYLTYPGSRFGQKEPVSSVRLEQAREGVEDYEYLLILKKRAHETGDTQAQALLLETAGLVDIPNPGGRYSTGILPHPEALAALRRRWGETIQRLGAARAQE